MRDVWDTVGFTNWDIRGELFETLREVCNSSFGWQPLHLVVCSEALPYFISTFLIFSNWLETWCTKPKFFIVVRPIIKSKIVFKIITFSSKVFILFICSLNSVHFLSLLYNLSVCSGLDNTCCDILKSVIISVHCFNQRVNKNDTFELKAVILKSSPLDLIIGRTRSRTSNS